MRKGLVGYGVVMLAALSLGLAGCADDVGNGSEVGEANSTGGGSGTGSGADKTTDPGSQAGSGGGSSGGGGFSGGADAGSWASDASAGPWPGNPGGNGSGDNAGGGEEPVGGVDAGSTAGPDVAGDAGAADAAGTDVGAPECNKTDKVTMYLSADDSNSMAGATVARGLIAAGQIVYKAVRTYEMLNYYNFDYKAAKSGEVAVTAQLRDAGDGDYNLQIGVRAPDFDEATRRRLNVVLAVDVSSSMGWGTAGQTGIDLARAACKALVGALDKGDRFGLLAWGDAVQTVVAPTELTAKDDGSLAAACDTLEAKGTTGLSGGLLEAYALVKAGFSPERINRVVLLSDGGANVGDTDAKLIADAAKGADGQSIYLMGVGVGDAWNYNDALMDTVTDAGRGAYIFLDSTVEAWSVFGSNFLRHVEVAARDVQVALELPPTFGVAAFYGEQISTNKDEVEPQHLAANDAMIFHQTLHSCAPEALTGAEEVKVTATWKHPVTGVETQSTFAASFSELLGGDIALLRKGEAVVAYAEALKDVQKLDGKAAQDRIDLALAEVDKGQKALPADADLQELAALLQEYRKVFASGQADAWPKGGTGADPIATDCKACKATGSSLDNLRCALDLCDDAVFVGATYTSPTQSKTAGTFAAVEHFGKASNNLKPHRNGSYALMATGLAEGTSHSTDMGGGSATDPFTKGGAGMYNAMEWSITLKAPAGANGFRFRSVFFSQEYDEYVGSTFNDKFYVVLQAGSTNGGSKTVINYTDCRNPDQHHDFVCSPGMQFCNPRARYCYIAINTAASECCWLGGCPNGKATTDISGTGYSCAASQGSDSANAGSSTGWLMTEWPIEPGETFTITFHLHDTGDGIYDSEVILDAFEFVGSVTPGTWPIAPTL